MIKVLVLLLTMCINYADPDSLTEPCTTTPVVEGATAVIKKSLNGSSQPCFEYVNWKMIDTLGRGKIVAKCNVRHNPRCESQYFDEANCSANVSVGRHYDNEVGDFVCWYNMTITIRPVTGIIDQTTWLWDSSPSNEFGRCLLDVNQKYSLLEPCTTTPIVKGTTAVITKSFEGTRQPCYEYVNWKMIDTFGRVKIVVKCSAHDNPRCESQCFDEDSYYGNFSMGVYYDSEVSELVCLYDMTITIRSVAGIIDQTIWIWGSSSPSNEIGRCLLDVNPDSQSDGSYGDEPSSSDGSSDYGNGIGIGLLVGLLVGVALTALVILLMKVRKRRMQQNKKKCVKHRNANDEMPPRPDQETRPEHYDVLNAEADVYGSVGGRQESAYLDILPTEDGQERTTKPNDPDPDLGSADATKLLSEGEPEDDEEGDDYGNVYQELENGSWNRQNSGKSQPAEDVDGYLIPMDSVGGQ